MCISRLLQHQDKIPANAFGSWNRAFAVVLRLGGDLSPSGKMKDRQAMGSGIVSLIPTSSIAPSAKTTTPTTSAHHVIAVRVHSSTASGEGSATTEHATSSWTGRRASIRAWTSSDAIAIV